MSKNVQSSLWLAIALLMTFATLPAAAQKTFTVDDETYVLKELVQNKTLIERVREGLEFCPNRCYTDLVQHSVIECRASAVVSGGDQPPVDERGNFTGPANSWAITETHDLREISVFESGCEVRRNEQVVEVLGSTPQYFPGDEDIEDTRSPYEPPFAGFNCNDYPAVYDPATGEMVATVEIDLLIERRLFVCN